MAKIGRNDDVFGRKMSKSDRKMAVLMALQDASHPLMMSEIQHALGEAYPVRSMRRWLNELVDEGLVQKTGNKRSTQYQALRIAETAEGVAQESGQSFFSQESEDLIEYIKQPLHLRNPCTYQSKWIDAYIPNETFYLTSAQRALLQQRSERNYQHDVAGTYARHIYNRLMIDLSYNSSRLEGNTYSLLQTEKLLLEGESDSGKLDEEKVMILNHKEAIRFLVDNAESIIVDSPTICTLQYLLSDGLLPPVMCGVVRNHGVKIQGSTYIPVSNKKKLEDRLDIICSKAMHIQNPFEQSIFLLAHIAYLQAFEDCNKRTSRMSANIPLICHNLVPMSFNDVPKEDYTQAMLVVYELNDIRPLIDLYIHSYIRSCALYDTNIEAMGIDKLRIEFREQRREIIRHIISKGLVGLAIQDYLTRQIEKTIPTESQHAFTDVIEKDIELLSLSHVLGMGVSRQDFETWQQKRKGSTC